MKPHCLLHGTSQGKMKKCLEYPHSILERLRCPTMKHIKVVGPRIQHSSTRPEKLLSVLREEAFGKDSKSMSILMKVLLQIDFKAQMIQLFVFPPGGCRCRRTTTTTTTCRWCRTRSGGPMTLSKDDGRRTQAAALSCATVPTFVARKIFTFSEVFTFSRRIFTFSIFKFFLWRDILVL